jgi:hypothetical protein
MALGKLTFVQTGSSSTPMVSYDKIPEEVINDLEEAYSAMQQADGRIHAEFESAEEKNTFSMYATSWAANRPGGVVKFRWSPTKKAPGINRDLVGDFTIKRDVEAAGKAAEEADRRGAGQK